MKSLHERLIDELLDGRHSLSAREQAAANEIRALREKEEHKPKPKRGKASE